MDITQKLAEYVAESCFENIPGEVIERAKYFILDTIGAAIAGTTSAGTDKIVSLVKSWGGNSEATIWVFGNKVPSYHAAFCNSTLSHARELDDVHDLVRGHYNVTVLPAVIAVSEAEKKVSGKELLTAVILGIEIIYRIGIAMRDYYGWHNTSTLGTFGAAAGAGKILNLNRGDLLNCLGIAYSQVAGNHQCLLEGSLIKRVQPAFQSMAGVRSAYLASKGIDGPKNILEGQYGYYNVYGRGKYNRELITKELGDKFCITTLSFKPFPSCRFTHAAINAAIDLLKDHNIDPQEIEKVIVKVSRLTKDLVGRPIEFPPENEVDAQFSIPYTVATALLKGDVFISDFVGESINNQKVLELARNIKVKVNENLRDQVLPVPLKMTISLRNGKVFSKKLKAIKGNPQNPLSRDELIEKFRKCMAYSIKEIPVDKIDYLTELCLKLEKIDDISNLIKALIIK